MTTPGTIVADIILLGVGAGVFYAGDLLGRRSVHTIIYALLQQSGAHVRRNPKRRGIEQGPPPPIGRESFPPGADIVPPWQEPPA